MKKCTTCGKERSFDSFAWKSKSRGTRHSRCKDCQKRASAEWYQLNKDHHKKNVARNNVRYRGEPKGRVYDKRPLSEVLVVDSGYDVKLLKKRLILEEVLLYQCAEEKCPTRLSELWCDLPLTLQLDHINGVNNDNRLENLRLLCPNCHSQTPTWCGRNHKRKPQ